MTDQENSYLLFARALSDPTRQQIMKLTCCKWLSVTEIVDAVGVSQPTVSHHLTVLKNADLVKSRTEGKNTFYTLYQEKVAFCCGEIIQSLAPETIDS